MADYDHDHDRALHRVQRDQWKAAEQSHSRSELDSSPASAAESAELEREAE